MAVQRGYLEIVNALIEGKANVNAKNKFGYTPLHLASSKEHEDIVKALIIAGAHRTLYDNNIDRPLDVLPVKNGRSNTKIANWLKHGIPKKQPTPKPIQPNLGGGAGVGPIQNAGGGGGSKPVQTNTSNNTGSKSPNNNPTPPSDNTIYFIFIVGILLVLGSLVSFASSAEEDQLTEEDQPKRPTSREKRENRKKVQERKVPV